MCVVQLSYTHTRLLDTTPEFTKLHHTNTTPEATCFSGVIIPHLDYYNYTKINEIYKKNLSGVPRWSTNICHMNDIQAGAELHKN